MIQQLRRWLPNRSLVVGAESSYAVLELLACAAGLREPVTVITRLRLDAALYDPTPPRAAGTNGRPRLVAIGKASLSPKRCCRPTLSRSSSGLFGGGKWK